MRALLLIMGICGLLATGPAMAAPTCQDRQGGTIKCGAPSAMPVGWKPSPEQLWEQEISRAPGPGTGKLLGVFCGLALLFALIALLPDFDGWREDQDEE
jgi:hypothetical protein